MAAVVARCHDDRLDVLVGIEPEPPENDTREAARRSLRRVNADPAAPQFFDRPIGVAGEQPEQRPVGADAQNRPRDAVGHARQHCPAQPDRGSPPNPSPVPGASVAQGDVDSLLLVVVLLVGYVSDQFLVDSEPGISQVDDVHCEDSFAGCVSSWPARR
jgi:hypothetical protein